MVESFRLFSCPLFGCWGIHFDIPGQTGANLGTASINSTASLGAEWGCLIVFLLKAVRVAVCVWRVADAAPLAGAAVLFTSDEV